MNEDKALAAELARLRRDETTMVEDGPSSSPPEPISISDHRCCKTQGCPPKVQLSSPSVDYRPETLQLRIDKAMELNRPINPTQLISYDGKVYKIEDLPTADLRALAGYGHFQPFRREVIYRPDGVEWPYTPNMCLIASGGRGVWIDPETLVCPGCGLDFT